MDHLEEHSLIIKCKSRESMLKVNNTLKYFADGYDEDFTVSVLADYDVYLCNDLKEET